MAAGPLIEAVAPAVVPGTSGEANSVVYVVSTPVTSPVLIDVPQPAQLPPIAPVPVMAGASLPAKPARVAMVFNDVPVEPGESLILRPSLTMGGLPIPYAFHDGTQ